MVKVSINRSVRLKKAKLARRISKPVTISLKVVKYTAAAGGLALVLMGQPLGYLALALALLILLLLIWNGWDLQPLPGKKIGDAATLDQVLTGDVLAKVDKAKTPRDIWRALGGSWERRFITNRLLLDPKAVEQFISDRAQDLEPAWQAAIELATRLGQSQLSGGTLVGALIVSSPGATQWLAQLKLAPTDVVSVTLWQIRLAEFGKKGHKQLYGGIARDWAFGFTPLLNKFGVNLSRHLETGGFHLNLDIHQDLAAQVLQVLSQPAKNSVALVGETGVGKTTAVYSLAERLLTGASQETVKFDQVVALNAAALVGAAHNRGELETLIIKIVNEAAHAKNIILFFDDAQLFMSDATGSVDLTNVLLQILQAGQVRLILAMRPSDWQELVKRNNALAGFLANLVVGEPPTPELIAALQDQSLAVEAQTKTMITYQAVTEAIKLSKRYMVDLALPGKAIDLLTRSASHASNSVVTAASVQGAIEASLGVKVQDASGPERTQLLNLESALHRRMVNQSTAVAAVSDSLRRARAGVKDPKRPVGSFLFLGPTGVGKTELSKALADVYFGGKDKMIRLDMTEYANPTDVPRLLAGSTASGQGNTFLTQVRLQPFSVVVLDEIEKAHPDILNLLLQMLEEGQLTDSDNRPVSFKEAVIIATSNAGADEIRAKISAGQSLEQFQKEFIDNLINSKEFLPELINRFDSVVLFRPLTDEELKQVAGLMLAEVNSNLAEKQVKVNLTAEAVNWLVKTGNDPRLGARPLRRLLQSSVESVVAKRLLDGSLQPGQEVTLDAKDLGVITVQ